MFCCTLLVSESRIYSLVYTDVYPLYPDSNHMLDISTQIGDTCSKLGHVILTNK